MKKKLEYAALVAKNQKLVAKSEVLQSDLDAFRQTLRAEYVEKNIFAKNLTKEKTNNRGICAYANMISYIFIYRSSKEIG